MKIFECDMCGEKVNNLNTLRAEYKQKEIAEICDSCIKLSNKLLDSCRDAQTIQRTNFIRKFIRKFKTRSNS